MFQVCSQLTINRSVTWLCLAALILVGWPALANAQTGGEVDLIWEADTYAAPFYAGKSLYTPGSQIKLVAITHPGQSGHRYTWRVNGRDVVKNSTENTLTLQSQNPQHYRARVTVTNTAGSKMAEKSVTISPQSPEVAFYPQSTRQGVRYATAITGNQNFDVAELDGVAAVPWFLAIDSVSESGITYRWKLNNQILYSGSPSYILSSDRLIDTPNDIARRLVVDIERKNKLFQSARGEVLLPNN